MPAMWRLVSLLGVGLGLLPLFVAAPALADCTDLPRPGVNWRNCDLSRSDFPGIDVTGGNLRGASLSNSNLEESDFSGIDGYRVRFVEAVLVGAVFDEASLTDARFDRADLTGVSFRGVSARNSKYHFATLREADFTGANLRSADFTGADLSGAIWTDGETVCAEGSVGVCR